MRVIHVPTTVGGNPQGISRHLCQLGVDSVSWTIKQNYFGYPADKVICSEKDGVVLCEIKKFLALRYVFQCDVAFLNFGSGVFFPYFSPNMSEHNWMRRVLLFFYRYYSGVMARLEMGLLAWNKKPVLMQYQGDDARQGDYSRQNFEISFANRVAPGYYSDASDRAKRKAIRFYAKRAAKIYALNPDLLHVLPGNAEFLPYGHINLSAWEPCYTQLEERPLRIGHAPSHRLVKGTDLILEAADKLKNSGYKFELVIVEGRANAEAKAIYESIDVLIDQLFAGWYGGVAVEAMALGKPVIAYIRPEDLNFIPAQMREDLPIIQAAPKTVFEVLKTVLELPRGELLNKAKQSRNYVERWHDPLAIAGRIKKDIQLLLEKKM